MAEAKRLVQMQKTHPGLILTGATPSTDVEAIKGFLAKAGRTFPVMPGLDSYSKEAWGITGFPSVRVVKDGKRAGDKESDIAAAFSR